MQYGFVFTIVSFGLISNVYSHSEARHSNRNGRSENADIFNHLLGYYKLNPLKGSQVYKTFSNYMLGGGEKHSLPNYDSDENKQKLVKANLHEIEKVIHIKNQKHRTVEEPTFDIDNANIENFNVDVILDKQPEPVKEKTDEENFSNLFHHIGSTEMEDKDLNEDTRVTKLYPGDIKDPNADFEDYRVEFNGTAYNYIIIKNKTITTSSTTVKIDLLEGMRNEIEEGEAAGDGNGVIVL